MVIEKRSRVAVVYLVEVDYQVLPETPAVDKVLRHVKRIDASIGNWSVETVVYMIFASKSFTAMVYVTLLEDPP